MAAHPAHAAPPAERAGSGPGNTGPAGEGREPGPVRSWLERDGALLRLRLARPKANVVDAAMIAALASALEAHRGTRGLRAVLLDAEGPHFSFGASVEEHLPERCAAMLASLHALVLAMVAYPVPIAVAVRGQCLGGGLELALAAGPIYAAPDARLGQPEIRLGVFAPAASCLLPWRTSAAHAEMLLLGGASVTAQRALAIGLVDEVADDPEAAALAWFDAQIADKSAAALACALEAVRGARVRELRARLAEVERLYLDRLMSTRDAREGLDAFLAKRPPVWEHR